MQRQRQDHLLSRSSQSLFNQITYLMKANGPSHSVASIKEALFTLILNILNGKQKQSQGFFGQLEQERTSKRVNHKDMQPPKKGSQAAIGTTNVIPPPPPPLPLPLSKHSPNPTLSSPLNRPQPTAVGDDAEKRNLKVFPPSPPLQAHAHLPASPTHDTFAEDTEELIRQLENSMQEKSDCEALLTKDLEQDLKYLNAVMNSEPNSSKQVMKATQSSHRRKVGNKAPTPMPTHPKTRQASKGCLKK